MKRGNNVLTALLKALKIKHTESFSNKFYNEHPFKYNLLGLSKMLDFYGVNNGGFRFDNKCQDIQEIQAPFVAHIEGEFAVIYKISKTHISYRLGRHNFNLKLNEFCEKWTGIALLVEIEPNSTEQDYLLHRRLELSKASLKFALLCLVITAFIIGFYQNNIVQPQTLLSLTFNGVGVIIGYLLVEKQIKIEGSYSDKICSILKESDCNNVLESKASKLWGIFGWSEIGLAYFFSNLIVLCFFPYLINYSAILSSLSSFYIIWSIWYQKFRVKQWCVLCLAVQFLLALLVSVNLVYGYIALPTIISKELLLVSLIYLLPFCICANLIPLFSEKGKIEKISQEINSLKVHESVLEIFLKQQSYYHCEKSFSNIIFGNPDGNLLVTILSNPHCNPCGDLHYRIEELIKKGSKNLCIQYIFTSFEKELEISSKFLIATYLNCTENERKRIFNEWFKHGKNDKENFFKLYDFDLDNESIQREFSRHLDWKKSTNLDSTPTILINGYMLPRNYRIEDFEFIDKVTL
ncbi:vitamin K epoxide reductase family protein [Sphingobacterium deserti]|uniref:Vitamin K epoxide reductase n=1 Tax=Sphingobacterium deserti TaxID=1229276 RepID=A0A0B8T434_9SPHI|nr:vitamin K epoxide reductase family protein [Sphingobacterium deserti]KGE16126.1 hypothetical protein DI53_0241 [Sphingobacterium deserti]